MTSAVASDALSNNSVLSATVTSRRYGTVASTRLAERGFGDKCWHGQSVHFMTWPNAANPYIITVRSIYRRLCGQARYFIMILQDEAGDDNKGALISRSNRPHAEAVLLRDFPELNPPAEQCLIDQKEQWQAFSVQYALSPHRPGALNMALQRSSLLQ
jgi:hypothetical protein